MRVYFFDSPLSNEDVLFVQDALDVLGSVDQVRIPHVLPAEQPEWSEENFRKHQALVCAALRNAGIAKDRGVQVVLVAPRHMYWYSVLLHATYAETGAFPWLVQTASQRAAIGNEGATRILDTHGLMGFKT